MPKIAAEKGAAQVAKMTAPGCHSVGGVAGLFLQVSDTGARSWVLRYRAGSMRRWLGLGGFPTVTLAQARERAREARAAIYEGRDPVEDRAERRRALIAAQQVQTFDECARQFLKSKRAGLSNAKHAGQWEATLTTYASPHIGSMPVDRIALPDVLRVLEPIWTEKPETASRVRGRIESVMAWATVAGLRSGDNPARWKGHLDAVLPPKSKVKRVQHHAALPHAELPAFITRLRAADGIAAQCLHFAILTATRSGEARGARWDEIDTEAGTWTIPAERMKAGKEHRVPLSPSALAILAAVPRRGDYVFTAPRDGQLSENALGKVLQRMKVYCVPHGFRSTFRDWAGETTSFPREVIEHAMAHQLKDKAEAAYARGSLFTKRRALMDAWAAYCGSAAASAPGVVSIKSGRRR